MDERMINRFLIRAIATPLCLITLSLSSLAQTSLETTPPQEEISPWKPIFKLSGTIDTYLAIDNDKNAESNRPLLNSLNIKKNTAGMNLGMITGTVDASNYRGRLTLHYGDMPASAWVESGADPLTPSQYLQEGYAGVSPMAGLWIDAGYFLTHIGGEVICPRDNWMSTIALATQFEPFYQAGVRVSYDISSQVSAQIHLLQGYNRFIDNNHDKSIGYGVTYKPSDATSVSLTGIVGNEQAEGVAKAIRCYNSFLLNHTFDGHFALRVQGDCGIQQEVQNVMPASFMYSGCAALRYTASPVLAFTARGEVFNDKQGMLSGSTQLCAFGETIGMEVHPTSSVYIRAEARLLHQQGNQSIFESTSGSTTSSRLEEVISLGVIF
jgi:hypothetical protein